MNENQNSTVVFEISASSVIKAVLVLVFFYALFLLWDLLLVVLTAVVIASAIEPATRWFERYKIPRVPAVIIIYAGLIVLFFGLFYFFIPPLLNDITRLASVIPQYLEELRLPNFLAQVGGAAQIAGDISGQVSLGQVVESVKNAVSSFSGGAFQAASAIFGGVFSFVLMFIISFYLSVQRDGIDNFLKLVSPVKHQEYVIDLWRRAQTKIGRWLQGQLLLGVLMAVLVFLGLTVLGVPYAFLMAILALVFELIPVFGPVLSAIPAVVLAAVTGGVPLALMTVGLYIILQQFENHLIYPLVVSKVVGVPPILVILSMVIGGTLAGFIGILLSVPLAAAVVEYTNDVARDKHLARSSRAV